MIETDRLLLRPYRLEDHEQYRAIVADPLVMRFLGAEPLSGEEAWARILRYIGHWASFGYGMAAVMERSTGRFVGETGLFDLRRGLGEGFDGFPEAGWIFASDTQGRGYALEAAAAIHDWYDGRFGPNRTVCMIDPDNVASLRLAAKLGYKPFGERVYKGAVLQVLERLPARLFPCVPDPSCL